MRPVGLRRRWAPVAMVTGGGGHGNPAGPIRSGPAQPSGAQLKVRIRVSEKDATEKESLMILRGEEQREIKSPAKRRRKRFFPLAV